MLIMSIEANFMAVTKRERRRGEGRETEREREERELKNVYSGQAVGNLINSFGLYFTRWMYL